MAVLARNTLINKLSLKKWTLTGHSKTTITFSKLASEVDGKFDQLRIRKLKYGSMIFEYRFWNFPFWEPYDCAIPKEMWQYIIFEKFV